MSSLNEFFRRLYSNPALIWKAGAGLVFLSIALAVYFIPSLLGNVDEGKRTLAAVFIGAYGLFRIVTFYVEYKQVQNEEK